MFANPIVYLLLRDLQDCAAITIFAMVLLGAVAVPLTFIANNPDDFRALPKKLFGNWFVGVATTAGLWILLTAIANIAFQWLQGTAHLLSQLVNFTYFMCFVAGIRNMWRNANAPARKQPRTFSLKSLLIAQLVILSLCGLWIAMRRGEIVRLSKLQREQTRQTMP